MGDAPKGAYAAMVVRGDRGVSVRKEARLAGASRLCAAKWRPKGAKKSPYRVRPERDGAERR